MAATQEALDDLDDVTLDLVVVLQLRDVATMLEQDGDGTSATPTSAAIGLAVTEELLQYRADRRFEKEETELAEASALAVAGGLAHIQCASCNDNFLAEEVWQAPCSHRYCFPCLEHLHSASMRDETLYPPRCCKLVMPWDNVRAKISEELVTSFEKKKEELDTPTDKRTYCSDAKCAMFIGTKHIAKDVAACPACKKATCTMCKAALHHHEDCPADPALEETLTLAFNFGWQRCAKCKRVVDLAFGCYHITCTCRHEFCYLCGADWKTCACPKWDDERLEDHEDDEDDEDEVEAEVAPPAAPARPALRGNRVAQ